MEGVVHFSPKAQVPTGPPRFVSSLASCRLGDWQRPEFVLEWWGRGGIQRFQPPDRFECFTAEEPIWLFERCPHPAQRVVRGQPCAIWKRIG